ncbi:hypothetical protein [Mucilaginibacter phyllosphaerae]|uniref:Uncharacterized protein n=1 Tax=Mucilaginibacter phyllosphaerae TaxID=1812349 RepID=A0A4Y8AGN5_9SPHI|nr:hypothetical protein [Mucilaginibacter phyllosphaerae]MBB3968470.1 hypothetical protein [Mucilaginibacter phyllosphaerae]TEW67883.1 hypothetical protein E2R65_07815 [Mucilaginibacter phyllosphaerae]GGH15803.1 hypothetical protein GCM10007352_24800 [Mucilaginibacter phyllosphaerae]
MDLVFISNQIKYDILNICGLPVKNSYNLLTDTPLMSMGYDKDEELCRKLEEKLCRVAEEYNTGKKVAKGDVSKNLTVRQCIQLVIA